MYNSAKFQINDVVTTLMKLLEVQSQMVFLVIEIAVVLYITKSLAINTNKQTFLWYFNKICIIFKSCP